MATGAILKDKQEFTGSFRNINLLDYTIIFGAALEIKFQLPIENEL
jgi:uncharacterized ferredoxin-like protein